MRRLAADVDWWVLPPLALMWLPVVTGAPWTWHSVVWPLASLVLIMAFRRSRALPRARRASSWAVAALLSAGALQIAAGTVAGALSTFAGISSRFVLPWGLMWATSGVRGAGVGYRLGNAFVLTPFLIALAAGALRLVLSARRPVESASPSPENAR